MERNLLFYEFEISLQNSFKPPTVPTIIVMNIVRILKFKIWILLTLFFLPQRMVDQMVAKLRVDTSFLQLLPREISENRRPRSIEIVPIL